MLGFTFFGHAIPVSSSSNRESFFHNPSRDSILVNCAGSEVCNDCVLDGVLGRLTSYRKLEGTGYLYWDRDRKDPLGLKEWG